MVRRATAEDIPRVVEIEALSFPHPWGPHYFENALEDFFIVYEENREIAGYLAATYSESMGKATILKIAVDPAYRKRGIATQLIEEALVQLSQKNVKLVELDVKILRTGAIKLYERFGFQIRRTVTVDLEDDDDYSFYMMSRSLEPLPNH